ncbi:MAG TPA: flagellar hook basal-body protein [Desulfuromonadales bacterium]|nr:flagellar hook basal-body protein [Desulfuromonadales bacterium]
MSLTSTMFTGVSGLLNQAEGMSVIGNNIANVNTIGFKGSRMLFSDVLSTTIGNVAVGQIGHGVQIQKVDTIFSQSSMETTTSPTDLFIQGKEFFAVAAPGTTANAAVPATGAYYTRAGSFRVDNTGRNLITPDNFNVLDSQSKPIVFTPTYTPPATVPPTVPPIVLDFQKVISVSTKGEMSLLYADSRGNSATVFYDGNGAPPVLTVPTVFVGTANIPNPPGLVKVGGSLYRESGVVVGGSGTPVIGGPNGSTEQIISSNLELSNVDLASEFVKMIQTQRAYSANSKTITTSDEMMQEVLNIKR